MIVDVDGIVVVVVVVDGIVEDDGMGIEGNVVVVVVEVEGVVVLLVDDKVDDNVEEDGPVDVLVDGPIEDERSCDIEGR